MPHFVGHQSIKGYNVDVAIGQMTSGGGACSTFGETTSMFAMPLLTHENFIDM